jgi:hypothetical protein
MLIVFFLALLIGVSLGMLGGGGSILAVPVLTYAADLPAKEAIATSLLVVGTTSLFALVQHAWRGNVDWRTGGIFASMAMVGAFLGGWAADWFSGTTLLLLFAAMMVVTSLAMFRGKGEFNASKHTSIPVGLVVAEGLGVGAATGLVGAGGGFLVVPALVLLGGMDMQGSWDISAGDFAQVVCRLRWACRPRAHRHADCWTCHHSRRVGQPRWGAARTQGSSLGAPTRLCRVRIAHGRLRCVERGRRGARRCDSECGGGLRLCSVASFAGGDQVKFLARSN